MAQILHTYEVTVDDYGAGRYNARSRAAAKYKAFLSDAFCHLTFFQFLKISKAFKVSGPIPDGYDRLRAYYPTCCIPAPGTRIQAEGYTGTVLPAHTSTAYVIFQPDGKNYEVIVHPMSVSLLKSMGE